MGQCCSSLCGGNSNKKPQHATEVGPISGVEGKKQPDPGDKPITSTPTSKEPHRSAKNEPESPAKSTVAPKPHVSPDGNNGPAVVSNNPISTSIAVVPESDAQRKPPGDKPITSTPTSPDRHRSANEPPDSHGDGAAPEPHFSPDGHTGHTVVSNNLSPRATSGNHESSPPCSIPVANGDTHILPEPAIPNDALHLVAPRLSTESQGKVSNGLKAPTASGPHASQPTTRFRVLVVGQAGTGKTSLLTHSFGITRQSISHRERGQADIDQELTSAENPHLVFHDSRGIEDTADETLAAVEDFLEKRSEMNARHQVHMLWLCVQIPYTNQENPFKEGDTELLKIAMSHSIPVVLVFTKLDLLKLALLPRHPTVDMTTVTGRSRLRDLALEECTSLCLGPAKQLAQSLPGRPSFSYVFTSDLNQETLSDESESAIAQLLWTTQSLLRQKYQHEDIVFRRAEVPSKMQRSVDVGMQCYWTALASVTGASSLSTQLNIMHNKIIGLWNFTDPGQLLLKQEFWEMVQKLVQFVTPMPVPAEADQKIGYVARYDDWAQRCADFAGNPIPSVLSLSGIFVRWLAHTIHETPETLCCFMGYIIYLVLLLEQLLIHHLDQSPISEEELKSLEIRSSLVTKVDEAIHQYVVGFPGYLDKATTARKISEIIRQESLILNS
ncbi:hypothetical protein C8F01DRAFT_1144166 [Mycena amicta]|nr:hypothetical protein C8F01DRAFT_1144166 [Mycena amicta]